MNTSISGVKLSNVVPAMAEDASSSHSGDENLQEDDEETERRHSGDSSSASTISTDTGTPAQIKTFHPMRREVPMRNNSTYLSKPRDSRLTPEPELPLRKDSLIMNNGGGGKTHYRAVGGLGQQLPKPKVLAVNGTGFKSVSQADIGYYDKEEEEEQKRKPPRSMSSMANLSEWAPSAKPPVGTWSGIDHLPDWSTMQADDPTSRPTKLVQRDLDYSMQRLMNENVFEQFIQDPLGRFRFREFLVRTSGTEHKLDMLSDLVQYSGQINWLQKLSEGVHDMYLAHDSDLYLELPPDQEREVFESLQKVFQLKLPLGPTQAHIRKSLYRTEFQVFVKSQLVEHNRLRLGSYTHEDQGSGLGDCFCLTNPRLRENPIVLVSPGFTAVTGYSSQSIIGRNCRFLQGPGTAPDSVQRIRDALNSGTTATELLLNYRRDGTPFFCLLTIIPLRDSSGQLAYFIGGQTNVTGQLASSKGLSFLIGGPGTELNKTQAQPQVVNGTEVSPSLSRYLKLEESGLGSRNDDAMSTNGDNASFRSSGRVTRKGAAGAYDPIYTAGPGGDILFDSMSEKKTSGGNNFMGKLFKNKKQQQQHLQNKPNPFLEPKQRLAGAEGTMRKDHRSLQDQMEYFSSLYSKIIVFKRTKREITFVTQELLSYLGLPTHVWKDIHANSLVHTDVVTLLRGGDKEETKAIQAAVKESIRKGHQVSIQVAIKAPTKRRLLKSSASTLTGEDQPRYTTIHFTPLKDRENSTFAFVAIVA